MKTFHYKIPPEYTGGFGRLNLSGMTRLLQRAATDHTDELGYTSSWYEDQNTAWMARRHRIEVTNPVGPGETVRVETEVEDFKRIRSLRTYTVYPDDSDTPVGHGNTDWIYLDRTSNSLKRIPEFMIEDFNPTYEDESPNRIDFDSPDLPEDAPNQTYRTQFRDLDELAHVNNVVYIDYLTETILRTYGQSGEFSLDNVPSSFLITELTIQYLGQANLGNKITCHLNPTDPGTERTKFYFTITGDGERIVEGEGVWTE